MISLTSFALEKRLFFHARPGLAALMIVAILCCIAALAGRAQMARIEVAQTIFLEEKNENLAAWRGELVALEAGKSTPSPYAARPMNIRIPAVLPPAALGDFATSSAGLYPTTAIITGWLNAADVFASYEFGNPRLLALGGFDLSFVVVVIMPLLMIAVSFDILPGERSNGRLRLVSIQAGQISTSTWNRLILRNIALWAVFAAVTALLAALPATAGADYAERLIRYAAWLAVALIYGIFWFALISAANIIIKRSESVAAALFAAWAIAVFAVPALGGAFAEAAYPPPSRLAVLSEMRQGEVAAVRNTAELTAGFLADHPELTVSDEKVPAYYSSNFLANQEVAKRTTPVLEAFKQSRKKRSKVIGALQYLSPALIADGALKAISGADAARYLAYQDQAIEALDALRRLIGPSVVAKQRLTVEEFDAHPDFQFAETALTQKLMQRALPLGYLLVISGLLLGVARHRLAAPLERIL